MLRIFIFFARIPQADNNIHANIPFCFGRDVS
jgi:hypothetical protein